MLHYSLPRPAALGSTLLALSFLPISAAALPGFPGGTDCAPASDLKARYLRCEDRAQKDLLDTAGIAGCSIVYERLKETQFGGSFPALRAWYETAVELPRAQAPVPVIAAPRAGAICEG
jgi:hypothetical protein